MAQKPAAKSASKSGATSTGTLPAGFSALTPYLHVKGAEKAIAFYELAFGATLDAKMDMGGKLGHVEMTVLGAKFCFADEFPEMGAVGPLTLKGTPVTLMLYVADVDAFIAKAEKAGATVVQPPSDQFWGARMGQIKDPFGHVWMVQTHREDVSETEMQKRLSAMMSKAPATASADKAAPKPAKKAAKKV